MQTPYSGTPLTKKLGISEGHVMLVLNQPEHYFDLLSNFPQDVIVKDEVGEEQFDFIHLFARTLDELKQGCQLAKPHLKKNGMLWISWPKKTSSLPTEISKLEVMDYGLGIGLVDVKVAAIDKDWSAIKFIYRLKDR